MTKCKSYVIEKTQKQRITFRCNKCRATVTLDNEIKRAEFVWPVEFDAFLYGSK